MLALFKLPLVPEQAWLQSTLLCKDIVSALAKALLTALHYTQSLQYSYCLYYIAKYFLIAVKSKGVRNVLRLDTAQRTEKSKFLCYFATYLHQFQKSHA